ncbi:hypothetical protein AA313_de0208882 [Arthrobotrys entomopaga]|nr:hypothetical protein AA313_de0208882 [Arthrobotrys entomopaga]
MLQELIRASDICFERTGDATFIDTIIDLLIMADPLFTAEMQKRLYSLREEFSRARYYGKLGKAYADRYKLRGDQKDIDEAMRLTELSVRTHRPDDPERNAMNMNLALWSQSRFTRTSNLDDLRRAVELGEEALAGFPDDYQRRAEALAKHAGILSHWFDESGDDDSIDRAISLLEEGISVMTTMDSSQLSLPIWAHNSNLAGLYSKRGKKGDLDKAIDMMESIEPKNRKMYNQNEIQGNNLSSLYWKRFQDNGDDNDLSLAIEYGEKALRERTIQGPESGMLLCNVSHCYGARWERWGNRDDLDHAIKLATEAVQHISINHSNRLNALNTLGGLLGRRSELLGTMEDVTQGINMLDEAVKSLRFETSTASVHLMVTLGSLLCSRFERTQSIADIDQAVELAEKAVEYTPKDSVDWVRWNGNLSKWLGKRAMATRSSEDDQRSLDAAYAAVNASKEGDPYHGFYLTLMAVTIVNGGSPTAVFDAIWLGEKALKSTPKDHPERCNRLLNLGSFYKIASRFEQALKYLEQSRNCENGPPLTRVKAARMSGKILAKHSRWSESSKILQEALLLVPTVISRMLSNSDKQQTLLELSGLASLAAAVAIAANQSPYKALSSLEFGRGVIAGQLLDMRIDISPLRKSSPALAEKFLRLCKKLALNTPSASSMVPEAEARYESSVSHRNQADKELKELLPRIRRLKGCENFFLPHTEKELKKAAAKGPVIVLNVSNYGCHAFLLVKDQPIRTVPLEITESEVKEHSTNLRADGTALKSILRWLWEKIAMPVFTELGFTSPPVDNDWPRVWWIPTGLLTNFPFHAAGIHENGSTDTVLDRVVSSYSPSVRALMYGREASQKNTTQPASNSKNAVLVAMESTPPGPGLILNRLPFATQEVDTVRNLCQSIGLVSVEPERHKTSVLSLLRNCRLFHYAGHARSNEAEPSQGCLFLEDWTEDPLTVGDIRDLNLSEADNPPFLAFLGACLTGSNDAEKLVDEAINLVSSCQLAGFCNVIGSLWEVWDQHSVGVSRIVYETIAREGMTDEAVARGLHFAIRALREGSVRATVVKRGGEEIAKDLVHSEDWTEFNENSNSNGEETDNEDMAAGDALRVPNRRKNKGKILRANTSNPLIWAPYIHVGG